MPNAMIYCSHAHIQMQQCWLTVTFCRCRLNSCCSCASCDNAHASYLSKVTCCRRVGCLQGAGGPAPQRAHCRCTLSDQLPGLLQQRRRQQQLQNPATEQQQSRHQHSTNIVSSPGWSSTVTAVHWAVNVTATMGIVLFSVIDTYITHSSEQLNTAICWHAFWLHPATACLHLQLRQLPCPQQASNAIQKRTCR